MSETNETTGAPATAVRAEEPTAAPPSAGGHFSDPGKDSRLVSGIPVIPALDGFRAFAILAIAVFHLMSASVIFTGNAGRVFVHGALPNVVEVLFVISGFVVFLPTVARSGRFGSVGAYAIRRAARLLPAFWLALVVVFVLLALWPREVALPSLYELGVHLSMFFVPWTLVDYDFGYGLIIAGPVWTLSLEVTFYLILPLIAGIYFRHPLAGLAVAAAITIAWKLGAQNAETIAGWLGLSTEPASLNAFRVRADTQFPSFAFAFGAGMTAAWAYVRLRATTAAELLQRRAVRAQVTSLVALAFFTYLIARYAILTDDPRPHVIGLRSPWLAIGFAGSLASFMLATTLAPPRLQRPFSLPFARSLGDISYGVYLIHYPLTVYAFTLIAIETGIERSWALFALLAVIVLPLALLYGYLSARFLEQPIRRWAHRFGRRSEAPEAAAGAPPAPAEAPAAPGR